MRRILHIRILPIQRSIEDGRDDRVHTGVLLALDLEERGEQPALVHEDLLVVVEDVPQEIVDAPLGGVGQGELGCAQGADEELIVDAKRGVGFRRQRGMRGKCGLTDWIISRSRTYSISLLMSSKMTLQSRTQQSTLQPHNNRKKEREKHIQLSLNLMFRQPLPHIRRHKRMPLRIRRGAFQHRHLERAELRHSRQLPDRLGRLEQVLRVRVPFGRLGPDRLE